MIFGMISTYSSRDYTTVALQSFLQHTPLVPEDRLLLIDNDQSLVEELPSSATVNVFINSRPQSFAANMNMVLAQALAAQTDAVLLNNDLVFTPAWSVPFRESKPAIVSSISNNELQYHLGDLKLTRLMELIDFCGKDSELDAIAQHHQQRYQGFQLAHWFPFYCCKIPLQIIQTVGLLDVHFGSGGAEDTDYILRTHLAGFSLEYALSSYVLHFQGRSTWRGGESAEQTAARDARYIQTFRAKWGEELTQLFIFQQDAVLTQYPPLQAAAKQHEWRTVIAALHNA